MRDGRFPKVLTLPDYVDGVSSYSTYRIAATFPPPARGRIKVGVKAGSGLRARCFTKPFTPILNLPPLRGRKYAGCVLGSLETTT
jgi:hypothetical protein